MSKFGYYTYVLYSKKLNKFYVGYTENLKNRVAEHNGGKTITTRKTNDWQLMYYEVCINKKMR